MPLPRWLAHINKRVFNPAGGAPGRPAGADPHWPGVGEAYRTPLDALPLPNGYLFIPMYGPRTDWVKNILLAQAARLWIDGHGIELQSRRLVKKRGIWPMLPTTTKTPPGISSKSELPRMDIRRQGSET